MGARAEGSRYLLALLALLLAVTGCLSGRPGLVAQVLRVVGSDTMLPLTQRLAQEFAATSGGLRVLVEGGGSSAGIAALIAGQADVCTSSRPLTAEEARLLFRRHGRLGVRVPVARDALEVFVHPANPVRSLTLLQLKGIFTGRIRQWEKVGGQGGTITVAVRPPTSGTHGFFQAVALQGEEYAPFATVAETTEEVVALVSRDPSAVGYGGMAFQREGVVAVALEGVAPSVEAARSGAYPLSRYLYLVTVGPPEGLAKGFVDFALSPNGQRLVTAVGFISLFEDINP